VLNNGKIVNFYIYHTFVNFDNNDILVHIKIKIKLQFILHAWEMFLFSLQWQWHLQCKTKQTYKSKKKKKKKTAQVDAKSRFKQNGTQHTQSLAPVFESDGTV